MAKQCSDCTNWKGNPTGAQFCKVGKRFRSANDGCCCFYNRTPIVKQPYSIAPQPGLSQNSA